MSNLKTLRNRAQSIKVTKKITYAMQLVAASKLSKAKEALVHNKRFLSQLKETVYSLLAEENSEQHSRVFSLLNKAGAKYNNLQVITIITSNRGLCGGFNIGLVRKLEQFLTKYSGEYKLIVIGKKGLQLLKRKYEKHIYRYYPNTAMKAESIAWQVKEDILSLASTYNISCDIYYNHLKNILIQMPARLNLVPMLLEGQEAKHHYKLEGTKLLDQILDSYLEQVIYNTILENRTGEEGARMNAMDNANRSADKILQDLTLHLNRTRQARITKELIEVISGAEAV